MNINDIPSGEMTVIDANIILYAMHQESLQCKQLLLRCADNDISAILPAHVLAEIMHRFMIAEARDNGWIKGPNPARQLAEKPDIVKKINRYEDLMREIFSIGFQLESARHEDFITAMSMQRRFGLLTNDALSVALAQRLRARAFASADKVFARVQGLMVYAPDDLAT